MIYSIHGIVSLKNDQWLVIEAGGIGFKIFTSNESLKVIKTGQSTKVFCYFHSDNFELYGFLKKNELDFFDVLKSVSGIGPKMALKLMNAADITGLKSAIVLEDLKYLKEVGIGPKTASKIIFELKDKIAREDIDPHLSKGGRDDVIDALRALGYSRRDSIEVTKEIPKDLKTPQERIKAALKFLAKR